MHVFKALFEGEHKYKSNPKSMKFYSLRLARKQKAITKFCCCHKVAIEKDGIFHHSIQPIIIFFFFRAVRATFCFLFVAFCESKGNFLRPLSRTYYRPIREATGFQGSKSRVWERNDEKTLREIYVNESSKFKWNQMSNCHMIHQHMSHNPFQLTIWGPCCWRGGSQAQDFSTSNMLNLKWTIHHPPLSIYYILTFM